MWPRSRTSRHSGQNYRRDCIAGCARRRVEGIKKSPYFCIMTTETNYILAFLDQLPMEVQNEIIHEVRQELHARRRKEADELIKKAEQINIAISQL